MRVNVATWDRMIRFFFGVLGFAWAVAGGPFWSYLSVYLIVTSAWGICPIYGMLKIQTHRPHRLE